MRRWLTCIGLLALAGPATAPEIVAPYALGSEDVNSASGGLTALAARRR
jgi:hypothetical protein